MLQAWDWINVIGIILEIVGFVLLLNRFMGWISSIFQKLARKVIDNWSEKVNADLENAPKIPHIYRIFSGERSLKVIEEIGIILVLFGLIFQMLSVLIEKTVIQ